jgi:DNA-binding Xre family transcriptional regulator
VRYDNIIHIDIQGERFAMKKMRLVNKIGKLLNDYMVKEERDVEKVADSNRKLKYRYDYKIAVLDVKRKEELIGKPEYSEYVPMKQMHLSRWAEVHPNTLSDIINQKRDVINIETINKIATALQITDIRDLFELVSDED